MGLFKIKGIKAGPGEKIMVLKFSKREWEILKGLKVLTEDETIGQVIIFALNWLYHTFVEIMGEGGTIILNHPDKGEIEIGLTKKGIPYESLDFRKVFRIAAQLGRFWEELENAQDAVDKGSE